MPRPAFKRQPSQFHKFAEALRRLQNDNERHAKMLMESQEGHVAALRAELACLHALLTEPEADKQRAHVAVADVLPVQPAPDVWGAEAFDNPGPEANGLRSAWGNLVEAGGRSSDTDACTPGNFGLPVKQAVTFQPEMKPGLRAQPADEPAPLPMPRQGSKESWATSAETGGMPCTPSEGPSVANRRSMHSVRTEQRQRGFDELVRKSETKALGMEGPSPRLDSKEWLMRLDIGIGVVIFFNAAVIGWESTYTSQGTKTPFFLNMLEVVFLAIYTGELAARFYLCGRAAARSRWVKFDIVLVCCGYLNLLVEYGLPKGGAGNFMDTIMLVRMLRLVRLVRVVRLISHFQILWRLIHGMFVSTLTIVWTILLIAIIVYCYAVLGLEVIQRDDGASTSFNQAIEDWFPNLWAAMLTLFQGVMVDGVGDIYRPLVTEKPYLFAYFASFLIIVSVAFMNLVMSIMVEQSLDQANADKEVREQWEAQRKQALIRELADTFAKLDVDGSNSLSVDEIMGAPEDIKAELVELTQMSTMAEVACTLDYDARGKVEVGDFITALMQAEKGRPIELQCLIRLCGLIRRDTSKIRETVTGAAKRSVARDRR